MTFYIDKCIALRVFWGCALVVNTPKANGSVLHHTHAERSPCTLEAGVKHTNVG